ncbi:MAG: hypothetical protein ACR2NC_04110 [Thermodesulfobacteriota bacterium]
MKILSSAKTGNLNLSNDLQIELSLINSGLIITEADGSVIFIIKDSTEMINSLSGLKSLSINFTSIDRPEFPTINTVLKLKTDRDLSVKYDYFFNSDSEYELNLLQTLLNQNDIKICFFTDIPENTVTIGLERTEIDQLDNCIRDIKI